MVVEPAAVRPQILLFVSNRFANGMCAIFAYNLRAVLTFPL